MMPNVLRAEKHAVRQILQKDPRLDQSRDRLKSKTADRLNLLIHFTQLWNPIGIEAQTFERCQLFCASMFLMSWSERCPNRLPHAMFVRRLSRVANWIARLIVHRELRDLVAPLSIFKIAKAGMIRIELHDRVTIRLRVINISSDHSCVHVIRK